MTYQPNWKLKKFNWKLKKLLNLSKWIKELSRNGGLVSQNYCYCQGIASEFNCQIFVLLSGTSSNGASYNWYLRLSKTWHKHATTLVFLLMKCSSNLPYIPLHCLVQTLPIASLNVWGPSPGPIQTLPFFTLPVIKVTWFSIIKWLGIN